MKTVFEKLHRKLSLYAVSLIVSKKRKAASYLRNNNLGVSSENWLKLIIAFFSFRFHSALAVLEPQIYAVVEHFRAEYISLLSGRLVQKFVQTDLHGRNADFTILAAKLVCLLVGLVKY